MASNQDFHNENKSGSHAVGPPPFTWSQLWEPAVVNPINLKSYTIPIFNLADPYARSFHLSWRKFCIPRCVA